MIIFGKNEVFLNGKESVTCSCSNCDKYDDISFVVYDRYFHLFWIPTIVYYKSGTATCDNCEISWKPRKMPEHIKRKFKEFKKETRIPFWHFTGLILIGIFILFLWNSSYQKKKEITKIIENPVVGDVYYYKSDKEPLIGQTFISEDTEGTNTLDRFKDYNRKSNNKFFSTYKVVRVSNNNIYVFENNLLVYDKGELLDIDRNKNYFKDTIRFSKVEIKKQYIEKDIFDVKRD